MPRKFLRRYLPTPDQVRGRRSVRWLGELLHDPNLWHLNRRSVAGAFGVGLFCAYLPIPGQMIVAAVGAIWLRVNLPLSVALIWITNPVTIPPMFYFAYRLGSWILGMPVEALPVDSGVTQFVWALSQRWLPLTVGSLILATLAGFSGWLMVRLLWRAHLVQKLRERKLLARLRREARERDHG